MGLCYAGGMLAYSLLLWIPDPRMAIAMMVLQGVFLSAQAPTVYSLASSKFADRAGTAVPLVDAIGTIGAIPAPPLMGVGGSADGRPGTGSLAYPPDGMPAGGHQPGLGGKGPIGKAAARVDDWLQGSTATASLQVVV